MCFCEPVSFAAGGVLVAGGAFAGWKAFKINKRYFPVSQMPTLAGLQQFMEGHVWMGVNNSDPSMIWWAAMGFIFFAGLGTLHLIYIIVRNKCCRECPEIFR